MRNFVSPYAQTAFFQILLYFPLLVFSLIMGYTYVTIYIAIVYLIFLLFPILFRGHIFSYHASSNMATFQTFFLATMMSVFFGWNSGYYLFFFEILSLTFMNDFLDSVEKGKSTHTIPIFMGFVTAAVFFAVKVYCEEYKAVYILSDTIIKFLFYCNSGVVFISTPLFALNYYKQINRSLKKLKKTALLDELTILYNRRAIRPYLDLFLSDYKESDRKFGLAIIDIDDFKKVNDTYGHNMGDKVLIEVAGVLKRSIDDNTYVARWGGEEFLIIKQFDYQDNEVFFKKIENIRLEINKLKLIPAKGKSFHITVTAGCSIVNKGESIRDTISRADSRLYKGKNSGKNCTVTK